MIENAGNLAPSEGPEFPLTVVVLVPFEKKFQTEKEFKEYIKDDLRQMGFLDEDDEWTEHDKGEWHKLYGDVSFPPETIADYIRYTKQDVDEGRYGFDELDFEQGDAADYQWLIREVKKKLERNEK